jgi:hypothetical protein
VALPFYLIYQEPLAAISSGTARHAFVEAKPDLPG